MAEFSIERAQPDDDESIISLLQILYKGDVGKDLPGLVREFINSPNHLVLIALLERPIGLLIGSYRMDIDYECRAGLVDAIVVEEPFRGRGVGKALVSVFTEWARDRDCTMLQAINPNIEFFRKLGFKNREMGFQHMNIVKAKTP